MSSETETNVSEALEAITECPLCSKLMREATSLPCLHTFCLNCIGTRITNAAVVCPTCEKSYPVIGIRHDHFIQDIIDEGLSSSSASGGGGKTICDFCVDDDLDSRTESNGTGFEAPSGPTVATLHCLDCRRNLCADCSRGHRKHCASHVIVALDDVLVRRRSIARSVARCVEHPDESLKLFCSDCRTVVCVLCYAENHNTHQCKDVAKVAGEFKRQLRETGTWMDVCKTGMTSAMSDLEKEWRQFEDSLRDARSKIREKGDQMKRIIDGHMMRLTQELQSMNQGKWNEFESEKKAFNILLADVDHLAKYSLALTENGSPYHIADSFYRLQTKATQLRVTRPEMNGFAGHRVQLVFANPDPLERINGDTAEVLGRVSMTQISDAVEDTISESETSEASSRSLSEFELSSKSTKSINGEEATIKLVGSVETDGRGVMGVTILNNRLYFVCAWTNTIFVHSTEHPFSRTDSILVKDMKCPNDLASCPESECIYITDSEHGCVWRINDVGHSDRWASKSGQPWTISVSRGRVLLPTDGKPPQLNIYGPGGGILSRIRLPTAIESMQHAIELRSGNFIVSHGRNSGRSSRICEISKTGHLVRSFDGIDPKGGPSRSSLVKWPKHLAVGENEETVLVAEFSNHYVLRLNRSMKLDKILLSWDDDRIDAPTRLCLVPGTGRLLLAEPACVKIYDVPDLRSKSSSGVMTKKSDLFDALKK